MHARAMILGMVMTGLALPSGAGERMTLRVSPEVSFAPAHLVVRATVEANAANRAIEVAAESDDFYRSSTVELDGERAARLELFEFPSLPSGQYEISARLMGADGGTLAEVRRQIMVVASGEP